MLALPKLNVYTTHLLLSLGDYIYLFWFSKIALKVFEGAITPSIFWYYYY